MLDPPSGEPGRDGVSSPGLVGYGPGAVSEGKTQGRDGSVGVSMGSSVGAIEGASSGASGLGCGPPCSSSGRPGYVSCGPGGPNSPVDGSVNGTVGL